MLDHLGDYTVPLCNLETLQERIAKLNRKGARYGQALLITDHGTYQETYKDPESGQRLVQDYACLTLSGTSPLVPGGFTLAATLEWTEQGDPIIRSVPGVPEGTLAAYRSVPQWCDHCQTIRQRTDTYLVRSEDGAIRQIGSSCLRDYLGIDASRYAAWAECLLDASDLCRGAGAGAGAGSRALEDVLSMACACVRHWGYTSAKNAREYDRLSTASRTVSELSTLRRAGATVDGYQCDTKRCQCKDTGSQGHAVPVAEDITHAATVIAWVQSQGADNAVLSDYLYNLTTAYRSMACPDRRVGIVVSAVGAHAHATMPREDRATTNPLARTHYGVIGARVPIRDLTVQRITAIDGNYGTTYAVSMRDAVGRSYTWFASNPPEAIREDATVSLQATIKGHGEYKGWPQTVLTRCKVIA